MIRIKFYRMNINLKKSCRERERERERDYRDAWIM